MKIISWNCQGAFRKKASEILKLKPDILIIQECENIIVEDLGKHEIKPTSYLWYSNQNHKKGIAIFSFCEYNFELIDHFKPKFRYILPFKFYSNKISFHIFAVWAMNDKQDYKSRYIGQVWNAINYYKDLLNESTIIIGDFNSNKIWDQKSRIGNHSEVVNFLKEYQIESIYHQYFKVEHGLENHPTFYLQRNFKKPYHIDYCFCSLNFFLIIDKITIGTFEDWISYSDHVPLIINFKE